MRSQVARKQLSATDSRNLRRLLLLNVFEPEKIGARIRQARERAGLRQEDLASLVGVATRTIQNYEAGDTKPFSKLKEISAALGVKVEWLLQDGAEEQKWLSPLQAELEDGVARLLQVVEKLEAREAQLAPAPPARKRRAR